MTPLLDDVCDGCPQCLDLCEPCWANGDEVPATEDGPGWRLCADCADGRAEAALERWMTRALNGAESPSEQAHREARMK